MHDIDHTRMEFDPRMNGYGAEYEYEDDTEYDEYEAEYIDTEVFDEAEEMDLAAELLAVTDDQELDQFLGKLIHKAGQQVGKSVKSGTGRTLGGLLKGAVKKALPIVGSVLGGPVGGAVAGKLASTAGRLFGLELEGLSPEDQEFEVAKRVVRLAQSATKKAAMAPARMPPQAAAKAAVIAAAKEHAPGLLRPATSSTASPADDSGDKRSGRWVRRGSKIILLGV
jgi:uncharacterized protein (DUF697 family)